MAIHPEDAEFAKATLWPEETIIVTASQRRFGPGMAPFNPVTVVVTDKRIIIINRNLFGYRKDIETIPYNRIGSVRLENGFISASVYLRVGGYSSPGEKGFMKNGEQEGELDGLKKEDAKAVSEYLNKAITEGRMAPQQNTRLQNVIKNTMQQQGSALPPAGFIYCPKCKQKNDDEAIFCEACGTKLKG